MKFAEIIRNAGIDIAQYPNCANIPICLYDGKDRVISDETVEFASPLFEENHDSKNKFLRIITSLENEVITSMNVRVDEYSVVLFYKNNKATICFRKMPPIGLLGCIG